MIERPILLDSDDAVIMHPNKFYDFFFYKTSIQLNRKVLIPFIIYFLYQSMIGK